ncbi:MFS general substrate transporter [Viridothelium virens]|uniref:MFS general substrate transporter n=1 Tax=Viridothelium virens TaxID=1048519 RepID=A0A6A6GXH7_VIRVR|nr:MFS general substrate transporter [Viridothelium virens]
MSSTNEKPENSHTLPQAESQAPTAESRGSRFAFWKRPSKSIQPEQRGGNSSDEDGEPKAPIAKSSLGILNDRFTDEVPGSVLLLSGLSEHNEPLGMRHAPERTSSSSLPSPYPPSMRSASSRRTSIPETKRTADGKIILDPQPDTSLNDPLNWASWRRDLALLAIGFYSMLGGGMTPVLAAGFTNVAQTYNVSVPRVALTTGLYMMGLGVSNVIMSPTAILWGKRPVYLLGGFLFIVSAIWCAVSPNYASLVVARIFMGLGVAPVECLPSASVAEIFFLHERAYRLGIYTLLLLGGKNLIPLVSAAIIETLGWRWVFWIVAIVVGFSTTLIFLFVPETFWDRTPRSHKHHRKQGNPSHHSLTSLFSNRHRSVDPSAVGRKPRKDTVNLQDPAEESEIAQRRQEKKAHHVGFADEAAADSHEKDDQKSTGSTPTLHDAQEVPEIAISSPPQSNGSHPQGDASIPVTPDARPDLKVNTNAEEGNDYLNAFDVPPAKDEEVGQPELDAAGLSQPPSAERGRLRSTKHHTATPYPEQGSAVTPMTVNPDGSIPYTTQLRGQPPKSYVQTLRPFSGRLSRDKWWKAAIRPFILFAYPSVLWSAMVYALSVGWLIVLSESITTIYRDKTTYNFSALGSGLVYLSPFIGGILGTAVAGKVSDFIVRYMSKRNDGIYEPEFRLVMAIPVMLSTVIGLMGFGWSAQEKDAWIVPTLFFGIISFGCTLGSTTAITFVVDSYRQYAGEALVTLNFSKNIFHGLVFSLFFNSWLQDDGPKKVFLALGGIQLGFLFLTIPMYIYGKRARMWTVRKNLMEKF